MAANPRIYPPRQDTAVLMEGLLGSAAVADIVAGAQARYAGANPSLPWFELARHGDVSTQRFMLIRLYQGLADWLASNGVTRWDSYSGERPADVRRPDTILNHKRASALDLAFLLGALALAASGGKFRPGLAFPLENLARPVLALTTEPGPVETAFASGDTHLLDLLPLFERPANDRLGLERFGGAVRLKAQDLGAWCLLPIENQSDVDRRLADYLKGSVFSIIDRGGSSVGTGFFVTAEGHALTCWHVLHPAEGGVLDKAKRFRISFRGSEPMDIARWQPWASDEYDDFALARVETEKLRPPGFNVLPLCTQYEPGGRVCIFGFGDRYTGVYPEGQPCFGEVCRIEPELAVRFWDLDPEQRDRRVVRIDNGEFCHGLSGAPVTRTETGCVFAIQRGMLEGETNNGAQQAGNDTGYCIPVKNVLKVWKEYEPVWPHFYFTII